MSCAAFVITTPQEYSLNPLPKRLRHRGKVSDISGWDKVAGIWLPVKKGIAIPCSALPVLAGPPLRRKSMNVDYFHEIFRVEKGSREVEISRPVYRVFAFIIGRLLS